MLEVWGHHCTVESHWRLAAKPQPYPEQAEQGQPQVDCSMDRLPGGSVFVSPLAQFSMSPDKTRSHMRRNEARELWLRLKAQGCKQVAPQWGADVDV